VFAGMLGVTFFGIFLTPVFYYLIAKKDGGAPIDTNSNKNPDASDPSHVGTDKHE